MRKVLLLCAAVLFPFAANAATVDQVKQCITEVGNPYETGRWDLLASCAAKYDRAKINAQRQELREFLAKNPHYRYPGVALPNGAKRPLDPCWGKTRIYSTKSRNSC